MDGRWARIGNAVLGAWLILSAFAWGHVPGQFANTWLVGFAVAAVSLVALAFPSARYFNTGLAIWLFLSVFALEGSGPTRWNNAAVALLIFALSLVRGRDREQRGIMPPHRRRVPI